MKLFIVRTEYNTMRKEADKLEDYLKDIQNTGQLIGEILKHLDAEKCKKINFFIFTFIFDKIN